ncbi:MAG: PEP-CTERM sorting domain-containing protein [Okeania sp. SIO2D1]|nr:PEP-CTERM sorting domain-containing protein [Okeania sp. SIO2D1]
MKNLRINYLSALLLPLALLGSYEGANAVTLTPDSFSISPKTVIIPITGDELLVTLQVKATNNLKNDIEITGFSFNLFDDDDLSPDDPIGTFTQANAPNFNSPIVTIPMMSMLQFSLPSVTVSKDKINKLDFGSDIELLAEEVLLTFVEIPKVPPEPCNCTPPSPQGSLPKNPILTALMKPISASASTILSMFEQPAHAQVTDVCPPCPIPEPSSILSLFALGSIGASSTLLHKKKKQKLEKGVNEV